MDEEAAPAADATAAQKEPLAAPSVPKPPSAVLAFFLSLLATGLGHVYAGRARRAAAWAGASLLLGLPAAWALMRLWPSAFVWASVVIVVAFWLGAAADAARSSDGGTRPSWGRVLLAAIAFILLGRLSAFATRTYVVEMFNHPSASMIPTLLVGDHLVVDKTRSGQLPARADVIVFRFPEHRSENFVQRVVALPGDKIELKNGRVWLNDAPIPICHVGRTRYEDIPDDDELRSTFEGDLFVEFLGDRRYLTFYAVTRIVGTTPNPLYARRDAGPFVAKEGEVWVLGDNRNNSRDSLEWFEQKGGGVPLRDVVGKAFQVLLSSTNKEAGKAERVGYAPMGTPMLPASMRALQPELDRCLGANPPMVPVP